jgi:hypothetical protein
MGPAPCDQGPLSQRSLAPSWLGQWTLVSVRVRNRRIIPSSAIMSQGFLLEKDVSRIQSHLRKSLWCYWIGNTNKAVEISAM